MIKLADVLEEAKSGYDYGCVMLYCDFPESVIKLQDVINPEDLFKAEDNGGYGIETEAHCTLLYGLHEEVTVDEVNDVLLDTIFSDLKATGPTLFENEKFDVLKYDVTYPTRGGAFLHKANEALKQFPHTSTFPDYHPHMTIAYLKPGLGKKYVTLFKDKGLGEFITKPDYAVYSQTDGTKTKIPIRVK